MATGTVFVRPALDRVVRDPGTMEILPDEGWDVPNDDMFWTRRLRDADIFVGESKWDTPPPPDKFASVWDDGATTWDYIPPGEFPPEPPPAIGGPAP